MNCEPAPIDGVYVVEPRVFTDARGYFFESFQQVRYAEQGIAGPFVQDNVSRSSRGTLRGLHYQIQQPQGKLVSVTRGEVFDVAVDLRRNSPTFGHWFGTVLSDQNHRQMYIPPGCAHGFLVLSETADFTYKCTDYYAPQHERTLLWNDPAVGIEWPACGELTLSEKDRAGSTLAEAATYD